MISDLFSLNVLVGILTSGVRLATSYLYAAIGEMFGQISGVLNLGVEGIMLVAAYAAYIVVLQTENLWLGLLAAIGVGVVMGFAMAIISVTLKAEQGISGIGVYLFGLGLSDLLYRITVKSPQTVSGFPNISIPGLTDLPVVGPILFNQNLLVYGAFALVPIAWFVLNKTTLGLQIRAVGQNPEAADTLGISVARVRYFALMVGGAFSGLAGASLSIALLNIFQQNITSGQGFIAVALVYFGAWQPVRVMLGCLLFSMVNALQLWIQTLGIPIPSDVALMMPYVLTSVALMFAARQVITQPAALTKPFERGE
ncbi:MAG: ABC transporter permease [Chloroflexi bacterium]|nr:ABC transporter permease [Chloroflexota bacterium]